MALKTYSTLKRKTPLKAKTKLTAKTILKSNKNCNSYKKKSTGYKPKYKYFSIFTDDMGKCVITGEKKSSGADIHVHHIFGAANKTNSEKYGFLIPLRSDWHNMSDYGIHFNRDLELKTKRLCQDYWLDHYGTKEEFIEIFGKWW